MGWARYIHPALEQSRDKTQCVTASYIFETNTFHAQDSPLSQFMFCFFDLVCALLSALLIYEGEGLPADFGALAR